MDNFILTLDRQLLFQIIIQFISVFILFVVLHTILYKPVNNFLEKRKQGIADNIKDASDKLAMAETLKAEYEIKIKDIEKERTMILEEARSAAKKIETQIIEDAKINADSIKNRAMLDIEREQEKAKEDIRIQIIEVSSLIAHNFISKNIDKSEHTKLVDEAVADLEEVKWEN